MDNSAKKQIKFLRDANQKLNSIKVDNGRRLGKEFNRFDQMRDKFSAVASVLGPNLGFNCLCHQKHEAFLKIPESPLSPGQGVDQRFSLMFHNLADNCAWKCMEMSLDIHERGQDTTHEGRAGRQVRFAGDEIVREGDLNFITIDVQAESVRHLTAESMAGGISSSQHTEPASPPNLCEYIASNQGEDNQLGKGKVVMNAPDLSLRMNPIATPKMPRSLSPLELHLGGRGGRSLTTEERLRLSIQVTSGVLCLYATAWLAGSWKSTDIYFWHGTDDVDLNAWTVNSRTAGPLSQAAGDSTTSLSDPTILSLCRFLVELWFGAPWSHIKKVHGSSCQSGQGEVMADRAVIETILNWASDETISPHDRPFHEEGSLYADAVRNCLKCDFGQPKTSMTDRTFREGVYHKILCPLRWALHDFLNAQLQLFGATRASAAGIEMVDRNLVGGVTLYDENIDTSGTNDTKYVLLSGYPSSKTEPMSQNNSCGRVRRQYNADSTAFILLQAEPHVEILKETPC